MLAAMFVSNSNSKKKRHLIYVIAGKESASVGVQCEKLLDQLVEPGERITGLFNVDPAQVSVSEVLDELRTLPFLTQRRVVLIKAADDFVSENRRLLENYFDSPCPTGVLILTVTSWPARTKLAKKLPRVGKLISVSQPKPWQLPRRLAEYARQAYEKKLTDTAAELLIELAGDDLSRLYSEVDKLALFAHDEKTITTQHVELLVGHNRLFNCFAVIDAITAGNAAQAVDRLRNMFAMDKSTEFTFIGAFAFHFRRMFSAKALLEKGLNAAEVATRVRIWANKEAFFEQLGKMTLEQIGTNLQYLAETDYAIKTGRAKAKVAAEQFVLRLAAG